MKAGTVGVPPSGVLGLGLGIAGLRIPCGQYSQFTPRFGYNWGHLGQRTW